MQMQLKKISEQILVITGASSGIGLVTARMAARQGACVVLAARNERDLARAVTEITAEGGRAEYVVADVAEPTAVGGIADRAVAKFGRIDTWVNNASVSLYGRLTDVPLEDMRRLFDVNFWGVVHGCNAAISHLREKGGAIVNVGSVLSERAIPLQGIYAAAKHAVKAYTDTLRMELEQEGAPISVSLVKPASIDTPFFQKAKTYLGVEPRPVPPVYAPDVVAKAILECAQRPVRDVLVGGAAKALSTGEKYAPRLTDVLMERTTFDSQKTDRPVGAERRDNLYAPVEYDGGERGSTYEGRVMRTSAYTTAALHPKTTATTAAAVGIAIAAGLRVRKRHAMRPRESELPPGERAP